VFQPTIRVGGEVGVILKDGLGLYILFDLNQEAVLTGPHPQREERLDLVELFSVQETFTEWGFPQVEEEEVKWLLAAPT
jgi:hypothetical protein